MKVAKALAAFEQRDYVNERDLTDAVRALSRVARAFTPAWI